MDAHDKAHYSLAGLVGAGLIGLASITFGIQGKTDRVIAHEWPEMTEVQLTSLAASLSALPHHEVTIYCASNCGTMPDDISDAFTSAGWTPHIESVIASNVTGLFVGPANDEGKAVADAIKGALGVKPAVGDQDGPDVFTVTVGRKGR